MKLIMTKGLPASGKTTWAKTQNAKRVNKDDLRAMVDDSKWSPKNEKNILAARDNLIAQFLREGHDVIVDDTNLSPKHEKDLRDAAQQWGADFAVKDFTDVPVDTCLRRDSQRVNSVGRKVIMGMYNQFLKPGIVSYPVRDDLPWCIIVDIDGTLAHTNGRSPYDYTKVDTDTVDKEIRYIVRLAKTPDEDTGFPANYVIIMSGRDSCKEATQEWLDRNGIPWDELHMRADGDKREDSVVKRELFDKWVRDRYNVRFVLDDRDRVVRMWRDLGLKVLQVAEGDF